MRSFRLAFALPLLWGAAALGQEITSPADVLPAGTLAYVELRQPGQLAKELAGLLEGSVLGNVPDSFAKIQGKFSAPRMRGGPAEIASAGVMAAPELVNEISRIRGAAVAITGIDKTDRNQPEFVAFVMPGESNAPGLIYRMFLATFGYGYINSDGKTQTEFRTSMEPIGETEGVRIYQGINRRTTFAAGPNGQRGEVKGEPIVKPEGPALARLTSGTILIGSPERLKDVIRRAKGLEKRELSLAQLKPFQDASKQVGDRPGLFVFGNPAPVLALAEEMLPKFIQEPFAAVKKILNPAAVGGLAGSLTLDNGTLSVRWLARLDATEKSPVFEILPSKPLNADILNFAPRDALFVAAISNADGEMRWERLVQLADQVAKAVAPPNIPPPSRLIAAAEGGLGMKIGKDLLGKVEAVAFAIPSAQWLETAKGLQTAPPVLAIIRATDEDAAKALAKEAIPQIIGTATLQYGMQPTEKSIGGQTVYEFAIGKSGPTLTYGRNGATLVLGMNQALVAEALTAGGKKEGFLSGEKAETAAAALKRAGEPVVLVIAKPLAIAGLAFMVQHTEVHKADASGKVVVEVIEQPPDPMLAKFLQLAKGEEPLVLSLNRRPDNLLWEVSYPGLKQLVPKAVDFGVEGYFQSQAAPRQAISAPAVTRPAAPARIAPPRP
jgi:hypothetical protein